MRNWLQPDGARERSDTDDSCPKCHATTLTSGQVIHRNGNAEGSFAFRPSHATGFFSTIRGRIGVIAEGLQACLSRGHVWSALDPVESRAYIEKHGDFDARLKLDPFGKAKRDSEDELG